MTAGFFSTKRCRRYCGRLLQSTPGRGLRQCIIFMHMPKCGGTSLSEALYATVPIHRRIGVIDAVSTRRAAAIRAFGVDDPWRCHDDLADGHHSFAFREMLLLQHLSWGTTLIHGHLLYSEAASKHFGTAFELITVLRPPEERMISNYRMACRAGLTPRDFAAYLETPLARAHARVYLRYLSGQAQVGDEGVPAALIRARDHLAQFALIGFLDRPRALCQTFAERYGPRLRLPLYNRATLVPPEISRADRARMQALLAPDQEIFELCRPEPAR